MARIPPNHPTSMTGVSIIDWICDGEKFGLVYPDDYIVNGSPADEHLDLTQTYSLASVSIPVSKGYIHQLGTNDLVQAVETTPAVAARLSAGGGIAEQSITDLVNSWTDQTPNVRKVQSIQELIASSKVEY